MKLGTADFQNLYLGNNKVTAAYLGNVRRPVSKAQALLNEAICLNDLTTHTRPSDAYDPYLASIATGARGSNLLLWSNSPTNGAWTKSNTTIDVLSDGSRLNMTTASALISQSATITKSSVVFSLYCRNKTGVGNVNLRCVQAFSPFSQLSLTPINNTTSTWQRYFLKVDGLTIGNAYRFDVSSMSDTSTIEIKNCQFETIDADAWSGEPAPYVETTTGTVAIPDVRRRRPFAFDGWNKNADLVEGQRVNLITYSEDLNQNISPHWNFLTTRINATNTQLIRGINFNKAELNVSGTVNYVSGNSVPGGLLVVVRVAGDYSTIGGTINQAVNSNFTTTAGTLGGSGLQVTVSANAFRLIQALPKPATINTIYTASVYVKRGNYDVVSFRVSDGTVIANQRADFTYNFNTGVITQPTYNTTNLVYTASPPGPQVVAGTRVEIVNAAVDYGSLGLPSSVSVGEVYTTTITATMPVNGILRPRQLDTTFVAVSNVEVIEADLVRVSITCRTEGSTSLMWILFPSDTSSISDTQAGQGTWFGGAQLEVGSFCSTYIKTLASSVTRGVEKLEGTLPNFGAGDFTVLVAGTPNPNTTSTTTGATRPVMAAGGSSLTAAFGISKNGVSGVRAATNNSGTPGSGDPSVTSTASLVNTNHVLVLTAWNSSGDCFAKLFNNGSQVDTNTVAGSLIGIIGQTFRIGSNLNVTPILHAFNYNLVMVWNRVLSDAEILTISNSINFNP